MVEAAEEVMTARGTPLPPELVAQARAAEVAADELLNWGRARELLHQRTANAVIMQLSLVRGYVFCGGRGYATPVLES